MTTGLPGVLIISAVLIAFAVGTVKVWRQGKAEGRAVGIAKAASVSLVILALASATDYPLRTPIMMAVVVIFVLWFTEWRRNGRNGDAEPQS